MVKITARRRERAATVHVNGKAKYPVDSPETAKSAVKLLNSAKPPLTTSQRSHVLHEAAEYGVKPKSAKTSTTPPKNKGTKE